MYMYMSKWDRGDFWKQKKRNQLIQNCWWLKYIVNNSTHPHCKKKKIVHVGSHLSPVLLYRSYTCTTWHVFMSQSCAYPRADKATSVWKKKSYSHSWWKKDTIIKRESANVWFFLMDTYYLSLVHIIMYKKRMWPISRPTKTLIIAFIHTT